MASSKNTRSKKKNVKEEVNRIPWIITSIVTAVLLFFAFSRSGLVGNFTGNFFSYVFGTFYFVPLLSLFLYGIYYALFREKYPAHRTFVLGLVFLNVAMVMLGGLVNDNIHSFADLGSYITASFKMLTSEDVSFGGGILGNILYVIFYLLFEKAGAIITQVLLFVITLLLIVPSSAYKKAFSALSVRMKESREARKEERARRREEEERAKAEREEEERIRRERLMAEENALPLKGGEYIFIDDENTKEEPAEEPVEIKMPELPEETPVIERKVDHSDVLSKTSKYFINLDEELPPVIQEEKKEEVLTILQEEVQAKEEAKKEEEEKKAAASFKGEKNPPVRKKSATYHLPPISLLETYTGKSSSINKASADIKGEKIIEILKNFDINAELVDTHIGPSVTKFEVKPDSTVKVDRILNISNNIKMELAAKEIRIEAPIPGRSAVGIEVPNVEPIPVKMQELMKNMPRTSSKLSFALGKGLMGNIVYCDLAKMPHLLIAGATGSGKSVCINTIITSFLFRTHPDDLKLVLIDPKKVEFTPYHDIPHLLWPVITDTTMACTMLEKATVIMENRYDVFAEAGVRNIQAYNEYVVQHNASLKEGEEKLEKMPYIVIIIDELADLMAVAKKDVQLFIQRITQLARACGMHLVVATQRPSVDVITGIIKSNIPSRISFAVASQTDSRTILDKAGAEKLLGNGDMLYLPQGESTPIRLQGCYVTDNEVREVTSFVKKQALPVYEDSYFEFLNNMNGLGGGVNSGGHANEADNLFDEVVDFVVEQQKASTSLLQRRFGIGYNRAARLIDTLEERGIIGPAQGSKPREVYRKKEEDQ